MVSFVVFRPRARWEYEGKDYFYLETTGEGWEIGEIPDEYKPENAYLYPLLPVLVLVHDWLASQERSKLTLDVTVVNEGTALAEGCKVWAAFDAGDDSVWNQIESEAFNLNYGKNVTIRLVLDVPRNKHTRLIVGVLDSDDYLIDESYSEWFDT